MTPQGSSLMTVTSTTFFVCTSGSITSVLHAAWDFIHLPAHRHTTPGTAIQKVLWEACMHRVWWQHRWHTCHVAWGGISQENCSKDEGELDRWRGEEKHSRTGSIICKDQRVKTVLPVRSFIQETGSPSVSLESWVKVGGAVGRDEVAQEGRGLILSRVRTLSGKLWAYNCFC